MDWDDEDDEEAASDALEGSDSEVEVHCPHCGEALTLSLDVGGGASQEYVEDCHVCCRPMRVKVIYRRNGSAEVEVEETS